MLEESGGRDFPESVNRLIEAAALATHNSTPPDTECALKLFTVITANAAVFLN